MKIYTEVNYIWSEKENRLIETSSKSYDYDGEVAQCWVQVAIAAGVAVMGMYASWQAAEAAKKSGYATGKEYDRLSKQTMLTLQFNLEKEKKRLFEVSTGIAETGADKLAFIKREGEYTRGKTEVIVGGSGVSASGGTAAQQVIQTGLNTASNIMQNYRELQIAQGNLKSAGEDRMETMTMAAKLKSDQYSRLADIAREGGDVQHFAGMMSGFTSGVQTYNQLGGFEGSEDWFKSKKKSQGTRGQETDWSNLDLGKYNV
jgi:hypothetical protein